MVNTKINPTCPHCAQKSLRNTDEAKVVAVTDRPQVISPG